MGWRAQGWLGSARACSQRCGLRQSRHEAPWCVEAFGKGQWSACCVRRGMRGVTLVKLRLLRCGAGDRWWGTFGEFGVSSCCGTAWDHSCVCKCIQVCGQGYAFSEAPAYGVRAARVHGSALLARAAQRAIRRESSACHLRRARDGAMWLSVDEDGCLEAESHGLWWHTSLDTPSFLMAPSHVPPGRLSS